MVIDTISDKYKFLQHAVNIMEWAIKENHISMIALFKWNNALLEVLNLFNLLKIMYKFVYLSIKWFSEMNIMDDRLRSVSTCKTLKQQSILKCRKCIELLSASKKSWLKK